MRGQVLPEGDAERRQCRGLAGLQRVGQGMGDVLQADRCKGCVLP